MLHLSNRRPARIELFRPQYAQRLSIIDLIAFVTAFAIWFAGMRIAGFDGFVLGLFALQAASGRVLRRDDWQLGALTGALATLGSTAAALLVFGAQRIEHMTLMLVLCWAMGMIAALLFHRDSGQGRRDVIAAGILAIATSVPGCLLLKLS